MDSEHRHELQQNDLQEFFRHFNKWWEKYGTSTLVVVLVALAVFAGVRFWRSSRASAHEEAWIDVATVTSPEVARTRAQMHENPVRAILYLRGADLIMKELAVPQEAAEAQTQPAAAESPFGVRRTTASDTPEQSLASAAQMYEAVAQDQSAALVYRLNAHLGLGAVAEQSGKWDDARRHYEKVIDLAAEKYDFIRQQAQGRQAMLERLAEPVAFAPEPKVQATIPSTPEAPPPTINVRPAPGAADGAATSTAPAPAAGDAPADNATPAAPATRPAN
jgi:hypothetical protein